MKQKQHTTSADCCCCCYCWRFYLPFARNASLWVHRDPAKLARRCAKKRNKLSTLVQRRRTAVCWRQTLCLSSPILRACSTLSKACALFISSWVLMWNRIYIVAVVINVGMPWGVYHAYGYITGLRTSIHTGQGKVREVTTRGVELCVLPFLTAHVMSFLTSTLSRQSTPSVLARTTRVVHRGNNKTAYSTGTP